MLRERVEGGVRAGQASGGSNNECRRVSAAAMNAGGAVDGRGERSLSLQRRGKRN